MAILATFPGRFGDILWSLPTVRALAEGSGEPVDLAVSQKYGSLKPLLARQEYLREVHVLADWEVVESAPMTPRAAPSWIYDNYEHSIDLGYKGWPSRPLPYEIYETAKADSRIPLAMIDLSRPWIVPPFNLTQYSPGILVGFTEEYFELKYGIYQLLVQKLYAEKRLLSHALVNLSTSSRWTAEAGHKGYDWESAAAWLAAGEVFLGCCSALHVLAVAVGCPAVVMEPAEARLHSIFWPLGQDGPQVTLVRGNDKKATFDARQTILTVEQGRSQRKVGADPRRERDE